VLASYGCLQPDEQRLNRDCLIVPVGDPLQIDCPSVRRLSQYPVLVVNSKTKSVKAKH